MVDLIVRLLSKDYMTSRDVFLGTLAISIRHRLDYETILSLLKLFKLTLLHSALPTTKTALWKILCKNDAALIRHMYCKKCKTILGKEGSIIDCYCGKSGPEKDKSNMSYFIQLEIRSQIEKMLKDPEVIQALDYRFNRQKVDPSAWEDGCDGREYKKLCEPGEFLSNRHNYSFIFNTDGCRVLGQTCAWPLYLKWMELPPYLRQKYMILAGVWVDKSSPNLNEVCKPLTEEMIDLHDRGITWELNNEVIVSKFIIIIISADAKARPMILNTKNPNGENGCNYCYDKGEPMPNNSLHRIFPYKEELTYRTDSELRRDMKEAFETGKAVNGVKGPSFLVALPKLNLSKAVVVESMHNLWIGVTEQLTGLILFSKAENDFYYGTPVNKAIIDERLLAIKPPDCISRKPRSILTYNDWKASENRNWLLYYLLPCLENLVPNNLLRLLAKLCEASYTLNKDSILPHELDASEIKIKEFSKEFELVFKQTNMTFNEHILRHIVNSVRDWGPIWVHSAFQFESWNYNIIRDVTSSNARALQIATRFLMAKFVEKEKDSDAVSAETRAFIASLLQRHPSSHRTDVFVNLGSTEEANLTVYGANILGFDDVSKIILYEKVKVKGIEYRPINFHGFTKFCNSYVCYDNKNNFGRIEQIVSFNHEGRQYTGFVVKVLKDCGGALHTNYIRNVIAEKGKIFVQASRIVGPAILIKTSSGTRAIALPNVWETE